MLIRQSLRRPFTSSGATPSFYRWVNQGFYSLPDGEQSRRMSIPPLSLKQPFPHHNTLSTKQERKRGKLKRGQDEGQTMKGRGAENVGRRAMWRKKGGPERGTALWTHLSELGQRTHPGFSSSNTCHTVLGKLVWQGPQSHLEAELGLASPQAPLSCHRSGALGTCYEQNMEQKESSTPEERPKPPQPCQRDQTWGWSSLWIQLLIHRKYREEHAQLHPGTQSAKSGLWEIPQV